MAGVRRAATIIPFVKCHNMFYSPPQERRRKRSGVTSEGEGSSGTARRQARSGAAGRGPGTAPPEQSRQLHRTRLRADGGADHPVRAEAGPAHDHARPAGSEGLRSEEHKSELQSLMRKSYAVFCLQKKTLNKFNNT